MLQEKICRKTVEKELNYGGKYMCMLNTYKTPHIW